MDAIWPTGRSAHAQAEGFSQISKENTVPLRADVNYPETDKKSIKRSQVYRMFTRELESLYKRLEYSGTGTLKLDIPSMEEKVLKTFRESLGVHISSPLDDFFAAGANSLQAIQVSV